MILTALLGSALRSILIALEVILVFLGAIRRDPKDRVLLFQTLALVSLIAVGVVGHFAGILSFTALLFFIPFVGFTFLAAYFGLTNWLRRKKKIT